jgi:hypothetical protein
MVCGAWICGVAWLIRLASPEGFYFEGTVQHWAPAWIPMVLGLSIFSVGFVPLVRHKRQ